MIIENESQLRGIYGYPSGRAKHKVLGSLDKHSINFIAQSPFLVLSTVDQSGNMDASPRGGRPGFVKISEHGQVLIPDFKGNNRVDSLVNIVETQRVGILLMIPGINETLRINGRAVVTIADDVLHLFSEEPKPPISCIVVSIEEVFLHCAKAFMRSKLWDVSRQVNPATFPSMGEMLKDQLNSPDEPETREAMIKRYLNDI